MRENSNEIRRDSATVGVEDLSTARGPQIADPLQFGRYDQNLSIKAARILKTPFAAEPEYNAFATPLQLDSLVRLANEVFSVRTRLSRTDEFVRAHDPFSPRDEIHAAQTIAPCLEAAALINPEVLQRGIIKRHQIARPFSCELDLLVYRDRLPNQFSPDKERLMLAQIEVDGRTIFVKGYPTNQSVSRVANVDQYMIPGSASLEFIRNSATSSTVFMGYDSMPREIEHEVLSNRKMQAYLMYEFGVFATIELCEVGHLPERMMAGYVARTENLILHDLSQLFKGNNLLQVDFSSEDLIYSENAKVLPIDFTLLNLNEPTASFRMYFGWDKEGKRNLWKTQVKPGSVNSH